MLYPRRFFAARPNAGAVQHRHVRHGDADAALLRGARSFHIFGRAPFEPRSVSDSCGAAPALGLLVDWVIFFFPALNQQWWTHHNEWERSDRFTKLCRQ